MKQQNGSSLVVALVLLTIVTLVAVYSIEGTAIQSKMVSNSLFNTLTYQECRNEQEANIRYFNENGGEKRNELIVLESLGTVIHTDSKSESLPITSQYGEHAAVSHIESTWTYIRPAPTARSGYELGVDAPSEALLFQNDCDATFRFAKNSQSLGAVVDTLSSGNSVK